MVGDDGAPNFSGHGSVRSVVFLLIGCLRLVLRRGCSPSYRAWFEFETERAEARSTGAERTLGKTHLGGRVSQGT